MCKTILEYDCRHKEVTHKACRIYIQAVQRAQRKTGFFKSLFCPVIPISCPAPPDRRAAYTRCSACQEKHLQAELARRQASHRAALQRDAALEANREPTQQAKIANERTFAQVLETRRVHGKKKKNRLAAEEKLQNRKLAFLCDACAAEGRRPNVRERRPNGYLCCSRGVDGFEAWERAGYASPCHVTANIIPLFPEPQIYGLYTDNPAARASGSNTYPVTPKPKSINTIRRDARDAADRYGWGYHRDSNALEPSLVHDYVNSSGADHPTLPRPPRAMPVYEPLYIDEDRWENVYTNTNHGRLPPQPQKPLPYRPLTTTKLIRKLTPKPITTIPSQQPSRRTRSRNVSPVTSPLRSASNLVSEINNTLDEELESWKDFASPVVEQAPTTSPPN